MFLFLLSLEKTNEVDFMTIAKAVEMFLKFVNANSERELKTDSDIKNFEFAFKCYLRSEKTYHEVNYKIELAKKKGYLKFNNDAELLGEAVEPTSSFTEYIIEREKNFSKFLYGLLGSGVAVVGGLIGALITALV